MLKLRVGGFDVCPINSRLEFLRELGGVKKILIAVNAEKLSNRNYGISEMSRSHIAYPDGIGAVLAIRRKGCASINYPGVELWLDFVRLYQDKKTFYLIGSTQHIIDATVSKLKTEFPKIKIMGYRNGYFDSASEIASEICVHKPDVILVAQGSPRQEITMSTLHSQHAALYIGLGGSFDIYVGNKKRAPIIFRRFGFEWLYRLAKEPTRIKRQLVLIKFGVLVLLNKH